MGRLLGLYGGIGWARWEGGGYLYEMTEEEGGGGRGGVLQQLFGERERDEVGMEDK